MSDEIQEIDDTITVPELNTITTIQADDAIMLTHANGVTEKIAAQNITNRDTFIIASTLTLTGPTLGTGFAIRVLFTAALTGLNASSPLVINYNGTDYTVKVAKDGELVNFVAKEFTENNTTVYKYLQAYTVLELIYNGTNLIIVGNPVVISDDGLKYYANGDYIADEVTADNMHSVTSNAVAGSLVPNIETLLNVNMIHSQEYQIASENYDCLYFDVEPVSGGYHYTLLIPCAVLTTTYAMYWLTGFYQNTGSNYYIAMGVKKDSVKVTFIQRDGSLLTQLDNVKLYGLNFNNR